MRPLDLFVSAVMSAMLATVGWIAINIHEISINLAVVAHKIDDHEKRIGKIEMTIEPLLRQAPRMPQSTIQNP